MLQPIGLDRWSQVTIYAKPSLVALVCVNEGTYHVSWTLQKLLANTPNRYRQAGFVQMAYDRCLEPYL